MRVAILGCGYVGLALGERLAATGHDVVGVRRSESGVAAVERAGLRAVQGDVTDEATLAAVPDADAVVYAASAGRRGANGMREVYVDGLRTAIDHFGAREHPPDRVVYTSSTGVYGDHGGAWVDEGTALAPETERERLLVEAERVARERSAEWDVDGTVVRFGGLYGPGRYRVERYLDGPVVEGYLNLLHRDDAAGVVAFLLDRDLARDRVVLAVDDEPVPRPELAGWLADRCGVSPPETQSVEESLADSERSQAARRRIRANKRCSNARLRALGYEFVYPTYREGYREGIAGYSA